jgi:ABC-type glycerol-3-phosphate transport system permease component
VIEETIGLGKGAIRVKKTKIVSEDDVVTIAAYIFYTIFALICLYPFYYILINSISANDISERGKVIFYPVGVHFSNFIRVFKIPDLVNAAKISVLRTAIGSFATVFASGFLGYMFTKPSVWMRKLWYRMVVGTMYFNAGIIPWYLTMHNLRLTNNFLAYILPTIISPFFVVLCKTFVESTPKELQEAAVIDGAGTLGIFFRVLLPVIKPILATVAIFTAVGQWNSFQDTLLLMTDPKLNTLQFTLYRYLNQANSLKNLINTGGTAVMAQNLSNAQTATSIRMTVTVVVVTPVILIYPIFQRFFVKGIMIGSVKG